MGLTKVVQEDGFYHIDENGYRQGTFQINHANGTKWLTGRHVDGMRVGTLMAFYDNGNRQAQCEYRNGDAHGEQKSWYLNGGLRKHYFVTEPYNKLHGEYKEWDSQGNLTEHCVYINDSILEDVIPSYLSGKDKFALTMKHGVQWL